MTMTDYQREQADERAALDALGADVASALGDSWTSTREPDHWGVTLSGPKGLTLFVSFDRSASSAQRRERVTISGTYPTGSRDRFSYADTSDHDRRRLQSWEISVATKRGAETIAKEIGRRLLPGYAADLAALRGWMDENAAREATCKALAEELAALMGKSGRVYADTRSDSTSYEVSWSPVGDGYGRWRVSPDHVYTDRMSIPMDKARRIAAILAE